MKRILSLLLVFCMIASLAACGKEKVPTESASEVAQPASPSAAAAPAAAAAPSTPKEDDKKEEEPAGPPSADEQLALIAANADSWYNTDDLYADSYLYAVSDLDQNGWLEIIASIMQGTGYFTELTVFEVSGDGKSLETVDIPYAADHSLPDLYFEPFVRCYKTADGYHLVLDDVIRSGYAETYYVQDWLCLRDGVLECSDIAWCSALAYGTEEAGDFRMEYLYYPGGTEDSNSMLTREEYLDAANRFFDGAEKQVCNFFWCSIMEETAGNIAALTELLRTSYEGFGFSDDLEYFDGLVSDPENNWYEGDGPGVYTMDDLLGEWYLYTIGTEFETRYAYESDADSTLTFLEGGLAFFSYADPTDARGAFLLTEMPYDLDDGYEVPLEGNEWSVVFGTDDGLNRFSASIDPYDGALSVVWFWWSEEDPGADPVITRMSYVRAMG